MLSNRSTMNRFSPSFDLLERRDAMSVTSVNLVGGTLEVTCDGGNDNVQITEKLPVLQLAANAKAVATKVNKADFLSFITVKDLTKTTDNTFTFTRSSVNRIQINAGAGNDTISSKSSKPTTVYAGEGNDRVETGAGADYVDGEGGNDTILTNDGNDSVVGGLGNDTMTGGKGDDYLDGGAGADIIFGGLGKDFMLGGDSNSTGNLLYGDADNDTIISQNRNDVVDGGLGFDTLYVKSGTWIVRNGEKVTIDVPTDQIQNDGWSCGPNSGSRFLRSYGINVSYNTLRNETQENSLISRFEFGTLPSTLRDILKHHKSDVRMETASNMQRVIDLLKSGKPVIALVAAAKKEIFLGHIGLMHYVVLNGYDAASDSFQYTDTNGTTGFWSRSEFDYRWKWFDHFTGISGEAAQLGLEALGMRKRTIIF